MTATATSHWAKLFAITILVTVATYLVHEFGHALAAKALGYDIVASINHVNVDGGVYRSARDQMITDLAGPLVTVAIALAAWFAGMRGRGPIAPSIVFVALMMRLVAAGVSMANPNDEARIGIALGLGPWGLFVPVIALLLLLFVTLYRRRGLGWKWLLVSYLAVSVAFPAIVFGEPFLPSIAW